MARGTGLIVRTLRGLSRAAQAGSSLLRPAPSIQNPAERERVRVLSAILLLLMLASTLILFFSLSPPTVTLLWFIPLSVLMYLVSRTRFYQVSAALLLAALLAAPHLTLLLLREHSAPEVLIWLAVSPVVAAVIAPLSIQAIICAIALILLLATPVFYPEVPFSALNTPLWFFNTISLLSLVGSLLRIRYIWKLRQNAAALRDSEERYRIMVEHSPIAIGLHMDGKVVFANQAGLEMFGAATLEDVIGKSALDLVHPDYHNAVIERIRQSYVNREASGLLEEKMIRLDGTIIDVEVVSIPFVYQGNPATQVMILDVTERKLAHDALKLLKEFNERILHNMAEGLVLEDPDGYCIFVNPAAAQMVGYEVLDLTGRHWRTLIPEDQLEIVIAANKRRQQDRVDQYELDLLHKDGSRVPVLVSGTPHYVDGKFAGTIAVFTHIKSLKDALGALEESEEKYRTIIETIEDGYYETDLSGRITFMNEALSRISGYPPGELTGMHYHDFMSPSSVRNAFAVFNTIYKTGEPARLADLTGVRRDGTPRQLETSASLIRDAANHPVGFRGIVRDVTERWLAEEATRKAYESLKEVDALKDQMIQNISHEFRTPLTYIIGHVDMVLDEGYGMGPLTAEQTNSLTVTYEQALRLRKLIENFIITTRVEERGLELETVDTRAWLQRAVDSAAVMAKDAGITLHLKMPRHLPEVMIDPGAMRQVIDNLLANAVKFTESGGRITVDAAHRDDKVAISVSDTGIGIAEEDLGEIFVRFYQVNGTSRRHYEGLGLGLAICKTVVEAHGETITVSSRLGKGTTFTFTLPVAPQEQPPGNQGT
nr:PAS domain S-box protein [Anaerolineae bacterium]